jgi:hypothetical protein
MRWDRAADDLLAGYRTLRQGCSGPVRAADLTRQTEPNLALLLRSPQLLVAGPPREANTAAGASRFHHEMWKPVLPVVGSGSGREMIWRARRAHPHSRLRDHLCRRACTCRNSRP